MSFDEETQTMIAREHWLGTSKRVGCRNKKLRRFRNYGLLPLSRTAAARAFVTLLPQADRFRSL